MWVRFDVSIFPFAPLCGRVPSYANSRTVEHVPAFAVRPLNVCIVLRIDTSSTHRLEAIPFGHELHSPHKTPFGGKCIAQFHNDEAMRLFKLQNSTIFFHSKCSEFRMLNLGNSLTCAQYLSNYPPTVPPVLCKYCDEDKMVFRMHDVAICHRLFSFNFNSASKRCHEM